MCCSILCITLLLFNTVTIYISLACVSVLRSATVSVSVAFLRSSFPVEHLSRMLGIFGSIQCGSLLLLHFNFLLITKYYYLGVGIDLVASLLMFAFPVQVASKARIRRGL